MVWQSTGLGKTSMSFGAGVLHLRPHFAERKVKTDDLMGFVFVSFGNI